MPPKKKGAKSKLGAAKSKPGAATAFNAQGAKAGKGKAGGKGKASSTKVRTAKGAHVTTVATGNEATAAAPAEPAEPVVVTPSLERAREAFTDGAEVEMGTQVVLYGSTYKVRR